jgi:hypothetical protein
VLQFQAWTLGAKTALVSAFRLLDKVPPPKALGVWNEAVAVGDKTTQVFPDLRPETASLKFSSPATFRTTASAPTNRDFSERGNGLPLCEHLAGYGLATTSAEFPGWLIP